MPEIVNPETHHEKSDVNVRALLWFVVILVLFGAVTHLVLWWHFNTLVKHFRGQTNAPLTSIAKPPGAAVPQEPRLQPFKAGNRPPDTSTPVVDMEQMRAAEEQALHTPGWVDKQKGIVRVPIEVAKQLAVQRLQGQGAHP